MSAAVAPPVPKPVEVFTKAAPAALEKLRRTVIDNGKMFAELMKTVRVCSLGQITKALFEVGGEYHRGM